MAKNFKTHGDRRKFRAGLKGDVDFVNQLNIMDLEEISNTGSSEAVKILQVQPQMPLFQVITLLREVPPIEVLKLVNEKKAQEISQSISDYFAIDEALEPALAVVCEVLRHTSTGPALKDGHTTFLGLSQKFQKLRSPEDREIVGKGMGSRSIAISTKRSCDRQYVKGRRYSPYSMGYCYQFQKNSFCSYKKCNFKHKCSSCNSKNHGQDSCRRKDK